MENNLISNDIKEFSNNDPFEDILNLSTSFSSSTEDKNKPDNMYKISPEDLSQIVNYYKERDEKIQDINYFYQNGGITSLLTKLRTDKSTGITYINGREEYFGSNKIFRKPLPTFLDFVNEAFEDKMKMILIFSLIFEIAISIYDIISRGEKNNNDWIDGLSIITAIFVVVSVDSIINYQKEMKFYELNELQNKNTKYDVIRNGMEEKILIDDILVGDLIKINYGQILPADMILVEGNGIKVDESSLTGETNTKKKKAYEECKKEMEEGNKNPSSMILLNGTNVIEGTGKAIVIAVGRHSQNCGIIRGTIDNELEDNQTYLEIKLNNIFNLIGYFGVGIACITFFTLICQMVYEYIKNNDFKFSKMLLNILSIIILCFTIIVIAIPEGLPLVTSLSLSFSIKRLLENNSLVRKMNACEEMGRVNVICTDKSGALTLNHMFVTKLITNKESIDINQPKIYINQNESIYHIKKIREDHSKLFKNEEYWDILYTSIALNVDCNINKLKYPDNNGIQETFDTKNKVDKSFIEFVHQYKSPIAIKREMYLSKPENYKILPFDSKKKRMTTFIKNKDFPTNYRLFTKGCGENSMIYCNRYIDKDTGKINNLDEGTKIFINNEINEINKKMMKSLYLCYKDISKEQYENINNIDDDGLLTDQKDLIFIGIFGLQDTLKPKVKDSIKKCHKAGVKVIMVTGDNLITATSIAKNCNILPKKIDLNNLRNRDIEQSQIQLNSNNLEEKNNYLNNLIKSKPYVMTGNSFYNIIEGIICLSCRKDTNLCKCVKSNVEAKKGHQNIPIKKDAIKNIVNFSKISTNLLVLANCQPIHKYALVLGLKALGNVVAVTGGGNNDLQALSNSDIGFSMNEGTEYAKEASDIILLDNNFSSIIATIYHGRSFYHNIKKFLQFQLTVNFSVFILVNICTFIGNDTPLVPIQMLWIYLIINSLGSLALATEPPYDEILKTKPINKNEPIISPKMLKHIVFQSIYQISILLLLYLKAPSFIKEDKDALQVIGIKLFECFKNNGGENLFARNAKEKDNILNGNKEMWHKEIEFIYKDYGNINYIPLNCRKFYDDWENPHNLKEAYKFYINEYGGTTHMTLIFNVFVIYTIFNQVNCRIIDDSLNIFKRINKSYLFCIIIIIELVIQIFIIQYGGVVFHCVKGGLSFFQWIISIGFSLSAIFLDFLIKFIPSEIFAIKNKKNEIKQRKISTRKAILEMADFNEII